MKQKLTNAKQLEGHALIARDGVIGQVKDFYFDDHRWRVRYCVVETGQWLHSRRVLIAPEVIGAYDPVLRMFPVSLTIDQVRHSPDIDTDKPVSRQHEESLRSYYGWAPYFLGDGAMIAPIPAPLPAATSPAAATNEEPLELKGDPHLHSTNATIGYDIDAIDGSIGHAEDFVIDSHDWRIRYLVIDTKNWWPGKKVVVPPSAIAWVSWTKSAVVVDLTREAIRTSPPYIAGAFDDPVYVAVLDDYYELLNGQPRPRETTETKRVHPTPKSKTVGVPERTTSVVKSAKKRHNASAAVRR